MPQRPELPEFHLTVDEADDHAVVAVAGEMDLVTAGSFADAVSERLAEGPVVLDLGGLSFMDSSGVRALDTLLRDAERQGRSLTMRPGLHDAVRQILEVTGMFAILPIEDERPSREAT